MKNEVKWLKNRNTPKLRMRASITGGLVDRPTLNEASFAFYIRKFKFNLFMGWI